MRIIVTGALGHIGSAFIRHRLLQDLETELVLVDDFSTQRFASIFNLGGSHLELIEGTVKRVITPELVATSNAVVHLAAIADPGFSILSPDVVLEHNFSNTQHVIAACLETNVPLVFPSSTSIYGGLNPAIKEVDEIPQPHTPYAQCKVSEEESMKVAFRAGMSGAILRFGTVFGTSMGMRFHTAVNRFCWQASLGQPITVYRTALSQLRPYLAVEDAASALVHTVLEGCFQDSPVNISTCNSTVNEIIQELRRIVPNLVVSEIESPVMNDYSFGVSTDFARELGYSFTGDLSTGIRSTMKLLSGIRTS